MTRAPMRALACSLTSALLVVGLATGLSPQAAATPLTPAPTAEPAPATDTNQAKKEKARTKRLRKERQKQKAQQAQKRLDRRLKNAVRAASSRRGKPYRYGGTGPHAFDCSGLTRWVYQRVGKSLPRTSSAQAGSTKRIQRKHARPGDLVFFHNGGRVYHVGVFAGGNQLWHAPRPGQSVHKARIWTGSVFFGRVR